MQIEALIAYLGRAPDSGGGASSHEGDRVAGNRSVGGHPHARRSVPMHTAGERASTANLASDMKRWDSRLRPPAPKVSFTTHHIGDGASNKPPARLRISGPIKAASPPRTKALHTLQGMKDMLAQMEQDMMSLEELREQMEKDLSVAR